MADTTEEKVVQNGIEISANHTNAKVYGKVDGENDKIVYEAYDTATGKRIPVTTKNFGREENHFNFEEDPSKVASTSSGSGD